MTTVRRSEIIDVLEWMATPSLLHLWMNETTHLLSMQIYRRSWIDTRSSINFFCCAKFVDRDDWSNNSAVFLVWNAIILRHLKERDAWIFRNAIIIKDKLILIVYVGGIVTLQVSLTQWRYIHHSTFMLRMLPWMEGQYLYLCYRWFSFEISFSEFNSVSKIFCGKLWEK